jgi:hypothetical protein
MKTIALLTVFAATASLMQAEVPRPNDGPFRKRESAPVYTVNTETTVTTKTTVQPKETYVYDQRPLPGYPALVTKEQADDAVNRFKEAYAKLGNPRMLIYVNRELVDSESGMRLSSRNEKTQTTRSTVESTVENPAHNSGGSVTINSGGSVTVGGHEFDHPGKGKTTRRTDNINAENRYTTSSNKPTLADKQTVRDIERLFGRPLRASGATLADQRVATQLIASRPLAEMALNTEGEQARKDREALSKIADVVVEILISSRNITVAEVSGDRTYSAPDIQATAIRLSDSKIIGQSTSRDVVGKDGYSGRLLRSFDVQEIAEATALALMDDISTK